MTKLNRRLVSLAVAAMYALCVFVAVPVQAYATTTGSHEVAAKYTKTQKATQTAKALKALAKLPTSKTSALKVNDATLCTLCTKASNEVFKAKNMGVNYKNLKNYNRLAVAKTRVDVIKTTFEGYVIDNHCFVKKPDPGLDTRMCLLMTVCEGDGYGIAVQTGSTYKFIKFDTNGHNMAKALITNTTKKDHISISVRGKLVNGKINVTSVVENQ